MTTRTERMTTRTNETRVDGVRPADAVRLDAVRLDGGLFRMGSDDHYPEEAPAHPVRVDGFRIDRFAVTNAQFDAFVAATGYVTVAERPLDPALYPGAPPENLAPGSMVFTPTPGPVDLRHLSQWWAWVPGASWRRPEGPGSGIDDRGDHPVVQVAHEDAAAYAAWAEAALPTEAQWEYAARGGVDGAAFTWGDDPRPGGKILANTWDGPDFPWRSTGESGWLRTAPAGSFAPNGYGLFDMAGNVWEWTDDWWTDRHPDAALEPCCAPVNPRGGDAETSRDARQPQFAVPRKVIKGGSFLCADTYCLRYRPAARRPQAVDTGMSHVGFRCVRNDVAPAVPPGTALLGTTVLGTTQLGNPLLEVVS
jgi:formylglycine-generating enzyme required for sulfatase activity